MIKNLTDFRKTVETGVDPYLISVTPGHAVIIEKDTVKFRKLAPPNISPRRAVLGNCPKIQSKTKKNG